MVNVFYNNYNNFNFGHKKSHIWLIYGILSTLSIENINF